MAPTPCCGIAADSQPPPWSQAKHTTHRDRPIGEAAVASSCARMGATTCAPQLVAITNARGFTDGARKLALERDVKLVDRDRLGLWPNHVLG